MRAYFLHTFRSWAIFRLVEKESLPEGHRWCKGCDQHFKPYRSWQEFCSPPCRNQYYERYVRHSLREALKILDSREDSSGESESENEKISGG